MAVDDRDARAGPPTAAPTAMTGVVLAGGRSRRMGTDKAVLVVDGERLVDRVLRHLGTICSHLLVASGDGARLSVDVPQVADEPGIDGPLAGLLAGLEASPTVDVAVVAVDAVRVDVAVLRACAARRGDAAVAAPRVDGVLQPFHAVWGRAALPALRAAAAAGERSPRRLVERLGGVAVPPAVWRPLATAGDAFARSWNRPEDLPGA